MAFDITPASQGAPLPTGEFPNFIQFRFNGVDLGGPDATVVDFVGSVFTLSRGTGADANKVTIGVSL
jgi:hypothetical protein